MTTNTVTAPASILSSAFGSQLTSMRIFSGSFLGLKMGRLMKSRQQMFNETASAIQRRLQFNGAQVVILPVRVY